MLISETFVNATEGYRFGESEPYEPYTEDIGRLYGSEQFSPSQTSEGPMTDSIKCPQCGKIRAAEVEAMPMCSLRYRLLDNVSALCWGHKASGASREPETQPFVARTAWVDPV